MNGLSLIQPWASAIVLGLKRYETRSWSTGYRGPLVIHSSKGLPSYAREFASEEWAAQRLPAPNSLPRGVLLCVVDLVAIHRTEDIAWLLSPLELRFGDYGPRRFAWELRNMRVLPEPIPFKGSLGLFEVPDELVRLEVCP